MGLKDKAKKAATKQVAKAVNKVVGEKEQRRASEDMKDTKRRNPGRF